MFFRREREERMCVTCAITCVPVVDPPGKIPEGSGSIVFSG